MSIKRKLAVLLAAVCVTLASAAFAVGCGDSTPPIGPGV